MSFLDIVNNSADDIVAIERLKKLEKLDYQLSNFFEFFSEEFNNIDEIRNVAKRNKEMENIDKVIAEIQATKQKVAILCEALDNYAQKEDFVKMLNDSIRSLGNSYQLIDAGSPNLSLAYEIIDLKNKIEKEKILLSARVNGKKAFDESYPRMGRL